MKNHKSAGLSNIAVSAVTPLRRTARVRRCRRISIPELKQQLLAGQNAETGFSLVSAPISPRNQTSFAAVEDGSQLLIGVCLLECKEAGLPYLPAGQSGYRGSVEILFDLRRDGLGFCHYLFQSDGSILTNDFSPYPEARSSRWTLPKARKWKFEFQTAANLRGYLVHWLWVWFDVDEIFNHGNVVGFNVCRDDEGRSEASAWNFSAANGFPDAQSLGLLCRGRASPSLSEPAACSRASKFSVTILNDVPDALIAEPYTPAILDSEMKTLRNWGIDRVEWIDNSNFPAFWEHSIWRKSYQRTLEKCPDLVRQAVRTAHQHHLEFIADIKLFDLAMLGFACSPKIPGALTCWDGRTIPGAPEMEGHEDAFLQSNPSWRRKAEFPIRRLRFYSSSEIQPVEAAEITISVSRDNRRYTTLEPNSYSVRVTRCRRPNLRWEPDGPHIEEGHFQNWVLEIAGLDCQTPFLEIQCSKPGLKFVNPAFLFVEAEDASGNSSPFEISQSLNKSGPARYSFHLPWRGWNNHNEWIVNPATWSISPLCLAFVDPPCIPGILEPTHPESQRIWLERIQYLLDRGVDGISLRLLCHHNTAASWLKYAFGPTVLDAFSKEHGRPPRCSEEDFLRIRKIRGEAITELLREIRRLCKSPRRKVIFQIETGAELPQEIGNRMQIHFDYEKWLEEGLVDEFHVRSITGHCPWLLEYLLPLAKRYEVQVHLVSRNLENGLTMQAVPIVDRVVGDAMKAGYDGFTFYEAFGLYEINSAGAVSPKGLSLPAIEAAVQRANSTP